jgi:hypothetical protein
VKIKLWRDKDGLAQTNVQHKVVRHSPTGFEWGYGGSGPADLALNILIMFASKPLAEKLYQAFKWDMIADIPREGTEIDEEEVKAWINSHKDDGSRKTIDGSND